jgi:hypothetical protein
MGSQSMAIPSRLRILLQNAIQDANRYDASEELRAPLCYRRIRLNLSIRFPFHSTHGLSVISLHRNEHVSKLVLLA